MKVEQQGFTLIELITVIVILGILSAFALPRFAGLEKQARIAAVNGMDGGVLAASALAHSSQLAQALTASQPVTMEGQIITMTNGYPTANAAGIQAALQSTSGFTANGGGPIVFSVNGAPTTSTCSVSYTAAVAPASPTVTPLTGGC